MAASMAYARRRSTSFSMIQVRTSGETWRSGSLGSRSAPRSKAGTSRFSVFSRPCRARRPSMKGWDGVAGVPDQSGRAGGVRLLDGLKDQGLRPGLVGPATLDVARALTRGWQDAQALVGMDDGAGGWGVRPALGFWKDLPAGPPAVRAVSPGDFMGGHRPVRMVRRRRRGYCAACRRRL